MGNNEKIPYLKKMGAKIRANIIEMILDIFNRGCNAKAHHLLQDAGLAFQPGFDRTDGIAFIPDFEFRVQNFEFSIYFLDCAFITHHQRLIV